MTENQVPSDRLERSMLYVPASRPDMIEKAAASEADAVCIDLEDAVAVDEKPASRANVIRAFKELDFGRTLKAFRMNGIDTPFGYRDLIDVVEEVGDRIDVVMMPKAHLPQDVRFVCMLLTQIENAKGFERPIGLEVQIESAKGFMYLREISEASPRLQALIFGPGDYSATMQMPVANIGELDENDRIYPGHRWHAVMHGVVAAARAQGLRAIDGPFAGYRDTSGLEHSARIARVMGFDGKQCIHPNQIPIVNRIFSPSPEEVAHAKAVVNAYDEATKSGRGAIGKDGKMIDYANIRMARAILKKRESL
ncbi:MAG: CoA ester lyase [Acidobacteria bacterium]|nr:MAG: CoA ester lyase [Acidobacteriota bacterium]